MIARVNFDEEPSAPLRFLIGYRGENLLDAGMWFLDQDGALVHVPSKESDDVH